MASSSRPRLHPYMVETSIPVEFRRSIRRAMRKKRPGRRLLARAMLGRIVPSSHCTTRATRMPHCGSLTDTGARMPPIRRATSPRDHDYGRRFFPGFRVALRLLTLTSRPIH
jgi:hypothetical protein